MRPAVLRLSLLSVTCLVMLFLAAAPAEGAGEVDHSSYDAFLKEHTRDGLVDYDAVTKDRSGLDAYLKGLSDSSAAHYKTWGRDTRMAFWINAYNAVTIYAVAANYPIAWDGSEAKKTLPSNSLMQIDAVWDTAYVELAGRPVTLNEIENEILHKEFGDPRVHFALVRASKGGPLLADDAYVADSLDAMLERDAYRFVNDGDKVRVNITRGRLHVSEIFEINARDFTVETGESGEAPEWLKPYRKDTRGFVSLIAPRVDIQTRSAIETRSLKVDYLNYDWSLNEIVEED